FPYGWQPQKGVSEGCWCIIGCSPLSTHVHGNGIKAASGIHLVSPRPLILDADTTTLSRCHSPDGRRRGRADGDAQTLTALSPPLFLFFMMISRVEFIF
uniref:Uncharacterized protein n=1 Tax=Aegilops tauschii subsp. strangulata TaxID=200361 RepID=A0A452ZK64_AEGTS